MEAPLRPDVAGSPSAIRPGVPVVFGLTALTAFVILSMAVARNATQGLDEALMRWLDLRATPTRTDWMLVVTDLGSWPVVAVIGLVVTGLLLAQGYRRTALLLVVTLLGTLPLDDFFKELLGRERPSVFEWRTERARGGSYPSGHTLNATVAYTFFAYLAIRLGASGALRACTILAAAALIAGVALSRVYLGVHYPSDVAGGFVLGCAWVSACVLAMRMLEGRHRA